MLSRIVASLRAVAPCRDAEVEFGSRASLSAPVVPRFYGLPACTLLLVLIARLPPQVRALFFPLPFSCLNVLPLACLHLIFPLPLLLMRLRCSGAPKTLQLYISVRRGHALGRAQSLIHKHRKQTAICVLLLMVLLPQIMRLLQLPLLQLTQTACRYP